MKYHLFKTKLTCPAVSNEITLSEDIKDKIMQNRIYHIPDEVKIMNQTINTYNTINNFVANMDSVEKIMKLAKYKHLEITDFETRVEDEYQRTVKKLEMDLFKYGFSLKHQDFMQIIDTLTKAIRGDQRNEFIEQLNFIYDPKRKRIRIYNSAEKWEDMLVNTGLNYLMGTIADYYLESYEIYLIRKLYKTSPSMHAQHLKCLEDYYHFISCFDIDPYVKDKYDAQILYNKDTPEYDDAPDRADTSAHMLVDKYTAMYARIYDNITNAKKHTVYKEVLDIIKSNSQNTVTEIDKDIINLIHIDEGFKEELIALTAKSI